MEEFAAYLARLENPQHRARMEEVLNWVGKRFPNLVPRLAWNQPMFTDHGTFIIGFSAAKQHLAVAPERATINRFTEEFEKAGHEFSKELVRFKWDSPVDFSLLERMIEFNILEKADSKAFWRK